MSLRRLNTGPELVQVESLVGNWSESPHQPALSEETRIHLRSGQGTVFVSDSPPGIASLIATKQPGIGMVEVAVPSHVSGPDFWNRAESEVRSLAVRDGYRSLELMTWDAGLRGELEDRGWQRARAINRGTMNLHPMPVSRSGPVVEAFERERDAHGLLEVNNLAFEGHPEAGNWDVAAFEARFEEPWFDAAGLLVTRDGPMVTGFCWTKVHPDGVGEIYLVAVRPGREGQGLGTALVTAGIEHLGVDRGCEDAIVYWDVANKAASSLYRSIGFSIDRVGEVFRHHL